MAKAMGDDIGMTVQFIEIPWKKLGLEDAFQKEDIDVIMSGVSVTKERQKHVDFVEPYMTVGQMVLIKADKIMSLSSKSAMYRVGKRFAVVNKTTGHQFIEKEFPSSKIMVFNTVEEGIEALKANQVDYFVHDAPTIWQYTVLPKTQDKELFGLYEYMTKEPLAWAVKKGNTNLLTKLNKALKNIQSRGVVNKIINHWIPLKVEVGN